MAPGGRTRILIVDDSAVMRSLLRSVVSADDGLEVAGTAADGASALSSIGVLRPDLILLDVEMAGMDGLTTLRALRKRGHKMPVIMCSSLTQRGAQVTLEALACGASDYVAKPAGQENRQAAIRALAQDLSPKIHALTSQYQAPNPAPQQARDQRPGMNLFQGQPQSMVQGGPRAPLFLPLAQPARPQAISSNPTVLAIGVSTGGPAALDVLLPELPANFPLPVLIVQHMPELFTKLFAERLNGRCKLRVREAAEGEPVRAGSISIARGNWHMEVSPGARPGSPPTLHLTQGPPENHCRPAVDVLFRSAAAVYGTGVLAVVLTGMGADGMLGCRTIREHGGAVLAQDQASSTVWGMPGAVVNAGLAHKVLSLKDVVPEILRLASRTHSEARELRESVV
jgi:two-component system, chemotaxis family, protein-glutamate methylesterase/glutaminase